MSSILSKKYKVALFVSGLGSNEYFFDETIRKMKTEQPNLVVEYSGVIDMSDYNPNENQFYGLSNNSLMPSSKALTSFCSKIANIVSSAKENGNKVILVRTKLGTKIKGINEKKIVYSSYDSIDNQALKLKKIINEICRINPETEIYLIGHSQGGLVNLKTSTLVPEKIKNLISISTPYSPVTLAYLLREIEFVANIFDKSLIMKVEPNDYIDYEERIKTLSDLKYINNLKNEWNNLIIRPKLNVIAGISSHLMTSEYFIIFCIPFELNYRYPFDGLVLGREQVNIENATINVLCNDGVECYQKSDGFKHSCCTEFSIINQHDCHCVLPCFDINGALFKSSLSVLGSALKTGNVDINNLPIIKAILEGIKGIACSDKKYKQYYDIIGGNYSHQNIVKQDNTIGLILGVLAN